MQVQCVIHTQYLEWVGRWVVLFLQTILPIMADEEYSV